MKTKCFIGFLLYILFSFLSCQSIKSEKPVIDGYTLVYTNPEIITEPDSEEEEILIADELSLLKNGEGKSVLYYGDTQISADKEGVGTIWYGPLGNGIALYNASTLEEERGALTTKAAVCIYADDVALYYLDTESMVYDTDYEILEVVLELLAESFKEDYYYIRDVYNAEEADIDGNGKVRFLISDKIDDDTCGFYYLLDQLSQAGLDEEELEYETNQSDMLYINQDFVFTPELYDIIEDEEALEKYFDFVSATLAHEYSHMLHFDQRFNVNGSLNDVNFFTEGMAMAVEYLTGYTKSHDSYIESYLTYMDDIGVFDTEESIPTDEDGNTEDTAVYGYGLLFFRYLIDEYGEEVMGKIVNAQGVDSASIEEATGKSFNEVFDSFVHYVADAAFNIGNSSLNDEKEGFVLSEMASKLWNNYVYYILPDGEVFTSSGEYNINDISYKDFSLSLYALSDAAVEYKNETAVIKSYILN